MYFDYIKLRHLSDIPQSFSSFSDLPLVPLTSPLLLLTPPTVLPEQPQPIILIPTERLKVPQHSQLDDLPLRRIIYNPRFPLLIRNHVIPRPQETRRPHIITILLPLPTYVSRDETRVHTRHPLGQQVPLREHALLRRLHSR